jgi:hypothetical protein
MVAPVQHTCQPPEVVLRAGGGTHTIMTHTKSLLAQRSCIAACELSRATAVMLGQFDNGHDILSHRHEWLEYAQPPARRWPDNAGAGRRRDNSDVTGHPCRVQTQGMHVWVALLCSRGIIVREKLRGPPELWPVAVGPQAVSWSLDAKRRGRHPAHQEAHSNEGQHVVCVAVSYYGIRTRLTKIRLKRQTHLLHTSLAFPVLATQLSLCTWCAPLHVVILVLPGC